MIGFQQCFDGMLHFGRSQVLAVFQLQLQAAGSTQARDGRRDQGKYLRFLDTVSFPVEAGDYILCRMTFPFPFIPVLQYDKIGSGIR